MAQTLGNYQIRLQGVGIQALNHDLMRTNTLLGGIGGKSTAMHGLATRFIGLGAVVSGAVIAFRQLSQWVSTSIQDFRDFELRMAEVSTILHGVSMNQLPALEQGVVSLSKTWGKNARDLANGLYDILSAAVKAEDSIRLLNTATKASIAGLTTVSTSVDVFTSILNAYGKEVSQAAQISDVLFQTVVRGKLRFEDLASAMGYVTPIAANAGVAFEEIAATLATVTRQGLHVDMASRGLALMIQGIVSPATAAADAAKQYGVDMSGLALQVKGLEGFMADLNVAMDEHGTAILPEIIRNMRSLRVAMALAGDEGVLGFTEDLGLMAAATGKTEEAMSKMMNTQQRQVEILANTMEIAERRIGESWSSLDIWMKKTKLWWGTALSGGDADATVKAFETQVDAMKRNYAELITAQNKYTGRKSLMDEVIEFTQANVGKPIKLEDFVDIEGVKRFYDMNEKLLSLAERSSMTGNFANVLEAYIPDNIEKFMADPSVAGFGQFMTQQFGAAFLGGKGYMEEMKEYDTAVPLETMTAINEILEASGVNVLRYGQTWADLYDTLKSAKDQLNLDEVAMQDLQTEIQKAQPDVDRLEGGFEDMTDAINKHKENILQLDNAIKKLEIDVKTTYTALADSSRQFEGKLDWTIAVKVDETKLDRFETFAKMAQSYGIDYMDKYIAKYGALDSEMSSAIKTIYEYNKATEEQAKAEKELQKELDINLLLIRQNNLEKMKLQLAGMMRRRGNTRSEQKIMKQIDIENLKLRIENMQKEVNAEKEASKDGIDALELKYDAAKEYLAAYIDAERHNLWLLKDIRDDEIRDLNEQYKQKKDLLAKYTEWYEEETLSLQNTFQAYVSLMEAARTELPDIYADIYTTKYIDALIAKHNEFMEALGKEGIPSSPKQISGENLGGLLPSVGEGETADPQDVVNLFRRSSKPAYGNYSANSLMSIALNQITPHATGIPFVPAEGLYHLHRGESVVPSNQSGSGSITVNVNVSGNTITDTNTNDVARQIATQVQQALIDKKSGKTKYRLR